jgi:hypothetical protein
VYHQLKELSAIQQKQVLALHKEAFSDSACTTCKGACCSTCASVNGYLGLTGKAFKEVADKYNFDAQRGFQTDTGCSLPLAERSDVCLSYMCTGDPKQWDKNGPTALRPFTADQRRKSFEITDLFRPLEDHRLRNPAIPEDIFTVETLRSLCRKE